jgi:hypothetical protein
MSPPKGHPLKIRLAQELHRETPMTLRWIATALQWAPGTTSLIFSISKEGNANKSIRSDPRSDPVHDSACSFGLAGQEKKEPVQCRFVRMRTCEA